MDDKCPTCGQSLPEPTPQQQLEANAELVAQMERTATDPATRYRPGPPKRQ